MKELVERIKWAAKLIVSKNFIVATEKEATMHVDLKRPTTFKSVLFLSEQNESVKNFIATLEGVVKEQEAACEKLFGKKLPKGGKRKKA